jgi:phosphate:Na+ symporter
MLSLLTVAGGVALILFSVRQLRKGLDRLFGERLGDWLQRLCGSRVNSFFSGIGVSMLAPSSTTMSVLAVQMVQGGHMTVRAMLALMLGVEIGLTVTVLLISLQLDQFAMVLVLFGVIGFQFTSGSRSRGLGQLLLALGLIFLAIGTIKTAAGSASDNADLIGIIKIASHYPAAITLVAALITICLQSSTATIGLVIGLAAAGIISLPTALAVVAGANVGVVFSLLFFGWNQVESRRLAVAMLIAKVTVAILTLSLLLWVAKGLEAVPASIEMRIALGHAAFNIATAVLFLPLVSPLSSVVQWLIPDTPEPEETRFGPRYINTGLTDSVPLALGQSKREIMHVAEIVRGMFGDLWRALKTNDRQLAEQVSERDDQIDLLDAEIKRFLTCVFSLGEDPAQAREQMRQLRYLTELETIGDIIDKNLAELVIKKCKLGVDFSKEGWQELDDFYGKVLETMTLAEAAFTMGDPMMAQQLLHQKGRIKQLEDELRDRHFARLNEGQVQTHETSAIHLDMLTHMKRISSCVTHVAYAILDTGPTSGSPPITPDGSRI